MNNFERKMIKKGIISNKYKLGSYEKNVLTPVRSSPKIQNKGIPFYKSRTSKTKRFNSTNARYKNVVNKIEKDRKSLSQIRKWSQGNKYLNLVFYLIILHHFLVALFLLMIKVTMNTSTIYCILFMH